ncbi:GNAT family N-acetyltransferase [Weissella koreensis]|uniref:GNAT family N-acetyltransferase n=1 Tax=Weissella koreensis TaxID=165096 RepID=A0A7H1MML9_9LACO|nr:GNAT family N-acetyltransferase [Weissella koreensis]AVH75503.1 N-acetyltransferase [Weissella koreensis]EJF34482.1 hypothetical protein JC2156_13220 [Weissella koreensis KCTC 3621]QGN20725.1 GNAT family N-acetyltransferase [Weissella koreensis]QNT64705.1 GNAT family N-acetyltransferase [Weissella koreensis]
MERKIKPVYLTDVKSLQQLSRETFAETFGPYNSAENMERYLATAYQLDQLRYEIEDGQSQFFFIYLDEHLAGYLKLNFGDAQSEISDEDSMEIERIYVKQNFHKLALGKNLMQHALNIARQAGKKYVWLGVWENNQRALKFYEGQGFVPFSEHVFDLGSSSQRDLLLKYNLKGVK